SLPEQPVFIPPVLPGIIQVLSESIEIRLVTVFMIKRYIPSQHYRKKPVIAWLQPTETGIGHLRLFKKIIVATFCDPLRIMEVCGILGSLIQQYGALQHLSAVVRVFSLVNVTIEFDVIPVE